MEFNVKFYTRELGAIRKSEMEGYTHSVGIEVTGNDKGRFRDVRHIPSLEWESMARQELLRSWEDFRRTPEYTKEFC